MPRRRSADTVPNRHALLTLFSAPDEVQSHCVRILLSEKTVGDVDIISVPIGQPNADLLAVNPYNCLPTLVDRDLMLYDPQVIGEYLEERFPHPSLMPADPVNRARMRLAMYRIEEDLYTLVPDIVEGSASDKRRAKKELIEHLLSMAAVFKAKAYFLSDQFSLLDCALAPILYRLPSWQVKLPDQASVAIGRYTQKVFARSSFQHSLTEQERELAQH